ncbi:hypothetical protein GCM10011369_27440 [Neiella marina]|uniref:Uncharacterized protein n=1 Tax=Neiella marina TaxID=508461 RepID=A0A8J2XNI7_9GAMM|nr:hypothetical protein [Neiella marina]GGA83940.1 hypothetical protein GCM10011369_27440 [Neiella marina]
MNISKILVQDWLNNAVDHTNPQARVDAIERIIECFGSFELAERYIQVHGSENS